MAKKWITRALLRSVPNTVRSWHRITDDGTDVTLPVPLFDDQEFGRVAIVSEGALAELLRLAGFTEVD